MKRPAITTVLCFGILFFGFSSPSAEPGKSYTLKIVATTGVTIGGKTLTELSMPFPDTGGAIYRGEFSGGLGIFRPDS